MKDFVINCATQKGPRAHQGAVCYVLSYVHWGLCWPTCPLWCCYGSNHRTSWQSRESPQIAPSALWMEITRRRLRRDILRKVNLKNTPWWLRRYLLQTVSRLEAHRPDHKSMQIKKQVIIGFPGGFYSRLVTWSGWSPRIFFGVKCQGWLSDKGFNLGHSHFEDVRSLFSKDHGFLVQNSIRWMMPSFMASRSGRWYRTVTRNTTCPVPGKCVAEITLCPRYRC